MPESAGIELDNLLLVVVAVGTGVALGERVLPIDVGGLLEALLDERRLVERDMRDDVSDDGARYKFMFKNDVVGLCCNWQVLPLNACRNVQPPWHEPYCGLLASARDRPKTLSSCSGQSW